MQKHKSLYCSAGTLLAALSLVPQAACLQAFATSNEQLFYCSDLNITYQVQNEWDHYQNISVNVTNPTDEPVYNWAIQYDAGGTISGIWNASVVESSGTSYVIGSADHNSAIPPHTSRMFGYTLDLGENTEPEAPSAYTWCLSDQPVDAADYSVSFAPTDRWADGAAYELTLTNNSEQPIAGWKLSFDSSAAITQIWNAEIAETEGSRYQISCLDWNTYLAPGTSALIGILAPVDPESEVTLSDFSLTASRLSYSLEAHQILLSGFSEFGANILTWSCGTDADYSVYRSFQGEDTLLDTVSGTEFYFDEAADAGSRYTYYITAGDGADALRSNEITLVTSTAPDEFPDEDPDWAEDLFLLEEDSSLLQIGFAQGDSADYVSRDLTLPERGENASTVRWSTNKANVIRESGEVIAPYGTSMTPVTLTAELKKGRFSIVRSFDLAVAPQTVYQTAVQLTLDDIAALNQNGETPDIVYNEDGYVAEIQGNCAAFPVMNAQSAFNALSALQDLLGIDDMSTEVRFYQVLNNTGSNVFCFRQYYQGIPIEGYYIGLMADDTTGTVQWLTSFYKHIELDTVVPAISAEDAQAAAAAHFETDAVSAPELIIYCDNNTETFRLAWKTVTGDDDAYISDAATGEVLFANEAVEATYTGYNSLLKKNITVNVKKSSWLFGWIKRYYLYDTSRNIKFYNAYNCTGKSGWSEYKRKNNNWSGYDAATAGSYNVAKTYDFFRSLGRKGYNNSNGLMKVGINIAFNETNAAGKTYRNKNVNNAWSNGDYLAFGAGDGTSQHSYAAAVDVVAHEFTHSVTRKNLNPEYKGESGALNEAYSDIFGEFVDPAHDWLHGKDVYISPSATSCNRNLINPQLSSYPQPDYYKGTNWVSTTNTWDNGGVHINSTVLSHAAYLMTQNDPEVPDTTQLPGIPLSILETIWYKSYACYGKSSSFSFHDCRRAVVTAAQILYGSSSAITAKVKKSFDDVGIYEKDVHIRVVDAATKQPLKDAQLRRRNSIAIIDAALSLFKYKTNAQGEVVFRTQTTGNYKYTITKANYRSLTCTLPVGPNSTYFTIELESEYNRAMSGYVRIADADTDPTNNLPLTSGTVTLQKISGSDPSLQHTWSSTLDASGHYLVSNLPTGEYDVTISSPGYMSTQQRIRITGTGTSFYNFTVELIPTSMAGLGSASGTITDAATGAKVQGLTLKIYKGLYIGVDQPTVAPVQTLTTGANGTYTTGNLSAGNYTVFVIDNRTGISESNRYLPSAFPVKILGGKVIANQNGTVSKSLDGTQLRVVLTWGSEPKDLDSHMYIDTASGVSGHTSFARRTFTMNGEKVVDLDLDSREGNGPETTTIFVPVEGTYTFYVYDYTDQLSGVSNTLLSNSGAVVTVYSGTSVMPVAVYAVPSGYGTTWKVFSYNTATAEITDYNTIMPGLPA